MEIYIDDLADGVTEGDLLELFEEFGAVDSLCMGDRSGGDGRRRFAVLDMPQREGRQAMSALRGRLIKGRPLSARENLITTAA